MTYISISGSARHGKDTTAAYLKEHLEAAGYKTIIIHYADLLKHICADYLGWNGIKDYCGRTLLQQIGTDWFRAADPDYWVKRVRETVVVLQPRENWDFVILADCRFPNEILGLHVTVIRPGYDNGLSEEQRQHPSETALNDADTAEAAVTVVNNGTLEDLDKTCKDLAYFISQLFTRSFSAS